MEDVSHLTGENFLKRPLKGLQLNEVRFNGKEGNFTYTDLLGREDGQKPKVEDLGNNIDIISLTFRRRLGGYDNQTETQYTSTEHNVKTDNIYLFGAREKGTAEELYTKWGFEGKKIIKTQRVIYCFLLRQGKDRELVRFIVKGATLNNRRESKVPGTVDLFSFIQDKPKDTHNYEYVTRISAVEEKGKLGKIYTMHFARGAKLDEAKLEVVIKSIKEIAEVIKEQDNFYTKAPVEHINKQELPVVEYPEAEDEGINPDEIPF